MIDLFDLPYLAEMPSPKSLFHFGKLAAKFGADKLRRYPRGTRLTMGNALAARLLASALDAGVTLRKGVSAEHLLVEGKRVVGIKAGGEERSEEHTSELQSLMRISYAVFCLKKKQVNTTD